MSDTMNESAAVEQLVVRELRDAYGVEGTLECLVSYTDKNFKLTLGDGTRYLVKLSQAPSVVAEIDLMVALDGGAPQGLALPRHRLSKDNRTSTTITIDGEPWRLRVLDFLDGTAWAEGLPPSEAQLYTVGERLAQLDLALGDQPWTQDTPHDWDLSQYQTLLQRTEAEQIEREMYEAMAQCIDFVRAREARLPRQLIYNDANGYNLFLRSPTSEDPCGLIDFGDVCHAFTINELAVAAPYLTDRCPNRLEALKQLTLGYHHTKPLSRIELECLPRLALLRILLSRLNYLQAVAGGRDSPYVAISQAQLLRQFRLFTTIGLSVIAEELVAACHASSTPLLLASRKARLASQAVLRIAGDEDGCALTITRPFGTSGGNAERQIQAGAVFYAEHDVELHSVLNVTRSEQSGSHLSISLRAHDLGGLTWIFASNDSGRPLPAAEVTAVGFRLPMARGQRFSLTCLWGEDDAAGMRRSRYLDEADWQAVCAAYIDPALVLGRTTTYAGHNDVATLQHARRQLLSPTLSHAYRHPLKIVRGDMAHLVAEDGRRYLDMVNNVSHVGHCNPRVVAAGARQMAELNTNTRYLHDTIVTYAARLLATLPDHLEVLFLVNSGSEANDLAMRLARQYTGRHGMVVMDHAYHGHLSSLIDISPYKHDGPGGLGTPEHVTKLPFPDTYRGCYTGETAAPDYLKDALALLERAREQPAAFYAESFGGVGGQWIWPSCYIEGVTRHLQAQGALYVADEVQVGFGRAGSSFWAFEQYDVAPDIVTMGKPIGNGHPIAAVATTRAVADSFQTGMEYFNTFAGNPVSCAIALAVLDEIQDRNLQQHAHDLGGELKRRLARLSGRFPKVGQVRGCGLFIGVEIISGPDLVPNSAAAHQICHFLRLNGVLLTTEGPDDNVLKIKPPLAIQSADVDDFLAKLEAAFELFCQGND